MDEFDDIGDGNDPPPLPGPTPRIEVEISANPQWSIVEIVIYTVKDETLTPQMILDAVSELMYHMPQQGDEVNNPPNRNDLH